MELLSFNSMFPLSNVSFYLFGLEVYSVYFMFALLLPSLIVGDLPILKLSEAFSLFRW